MVLIALSGNKGSGKSLCSSIIKHSYPSYNFKIISFAKPLKQIISTLFNFTDECYDEKKKELVIPSINVSPRQLLQSIGTDLFNNLLPTVLPSLKLSKSNLWISILFDYVSSHPTDNFIIDDLRFPDEYSCVKDLNGLVIQIFRPSLSSNDSHISEKTLSSYDYIITNDSSIEILSNNLLNILSQYCK